MTAAAIATCNGGGGDYRMTILGSFVLKPGNAKLSVELAVDALTVDPFEP
jgi:hypothetical protein